MGNFCVIGQFLLCSKTIALTLEWNLNILKMSLLWTKWIKFVFAILYKFWRSKTNAFWFVHDFYWLKTTWIILQKVVYICIVWGWPLIRKNIRHWHRNNIGKKFGCQSGYYLSFPEIAAPFCHYYTSHQA